MTRAEWREAWSAIRYRAARKRDYCDRNWGELPLWADRREPDGPASTAWFSRYEDPLDRGVLSDAADRLRCGRGYERRGRYFDRFPGRLRFELVFLP